MSGGPKTRTERKGERKRATTTKQNTSNSSYLVEEVTPQILSLGTKPFVSQNAGPGPGSGCLFPLNFSRHSPVMLYSNVRHLSFIYGGN